MKSRRVIGGLKTTSSIDEEGLALLSGAVRLEVEGPASTDCACAREETISAGALATGTNTVTGASRALPDPLDGPGARRRRADLAAVLIGGDCGSVSGVLAGEDRRCAEEATRKAVAGVPSGNLPFSVGVRAALAR
jgi:hypothetical protein